MNLNINTSSTPAPRPVVALASPWAFPIPTTRQLDNDLRLITVNVPGQHVLSVRLGIPAPLAAEPAQLEGVATMVTRGFDEGTARYSAQEFAELIERHGIALGAGVGERGVFIEMEVMAHHFGTAIDILAQCLTEAAYPDAEVTRLKRARLSDIEHEYADAGSRAAIEFARTYFEVTDRASRPAAGTDASVRAIAVADVREHYRHIMRPQGATIVVAGDLSALPGDVASVVEPGLASWTGSANDPGVTTHSTSGVRAPEASRIVLVDRPGSAQSHLLLGRPGPQRRTEHGWGAYQVLAFLLGGSPSARIDAVLREERGYTYGMRAGFTPRRASGVCSVSGAVRADATAPALEALMDVLALTGQDLTEREVRHGADYVAKTAPGRYSTADTIATEVIRLAMDGLDTEFVTQTVAGARSLTRDQAAAAWDEVQAGPEWTTVVVADASAHRESIEALGVGEVSVVPAAPLH